MPYLLAQVATTIGGGMTAFVVIFLVAFREPWARLFTSDTAIISSLAAVMLPLGISLIGDRASTDP